MNFLGFVVFAIIKVVYSEEKYYPTIIPLEMKDSKKKYSSDKNGTFSMEADLLKYFPAVHQTPLFVSITNWGKKNYLKFPNNTQNYSQNYHNLLGKTDKYYQKDKIKQRTLVHDFGARDKTILEEQDDIYLRKIIFNSSLVAYILRSQFISHFDNIDNSTNLLDFYDLNIFYNTDSDSNFHFTNSSGIVVCDSVHSSKSETSLIEDVLRRHNYSEFLSNSKVILKMNRIKKIQSVLSKLTTRPEFSANLNNYILYTQIDVIKSKLVVIEKELLVLYSFLHDYSDEEFDERCSIISQATDELILYLNKFNFTKSDFRIDLCYFIFFLLTVLIGVYLGFYTLKEFRVALERKTK